MKQNIHNITTCREHDNMKLTPNMQHCDWKLENQILNHSNSWTTWVNNRSCKFNAVHKPE